MLMLHTALYHTQALLYLALQSFPLHMLQWYYTSHTQALSLLELMLPYQHNAVYLASISACE
jgi:hypothetical protein